MVSQVNYFKHLEKTPVLLKLFQNIAEEGTHPNPLYVVTITLIPKLEKYTTKKKL